MKKTTYKTILLFLIYALALNPVSAMLADNAGGLLFNTSPKHCNMEGKAHKSAMQVKTPSSSMKMAEKSGCKCEKDCQESNCGQQCVDCGHFFAGFPALTIELIHNQSTCIKATSDLRHQLPMLVHYRPPISLHS